MSYILELKIECLFFIQRIPSAVNEYNKELQMEIRAQEAISNANITEVNPGHSKLIIQRRSNDKIRRASVNNTISISLCSVNSVRKKKLN